MAALEAWIERQYAHSARQMLRSISAQELTKHRDGLPRVVPRAGSIIASPVLGAYDPDPDYCFHWFRDSALVMDALRLLFEDGTVDAGALGQLADFVAFSQSLRSLDGRALTAAPAWRAAVSAEFSAFLRTDAELSAVQGDAVAADTRVNPDGTLDVLRWGRPQHDGPPLRALTLLRWLRAAPLAPAVTAMLAELLLADLRFARIRARVPCLDIWEEESGLHYYTLAVSAAALEQGALWLEARGDAAEASICRAEALLIGTLLDGYWLEEAQYYRSRTLDSGARSSKELDIAVILAAIHGGHDGPRHSVRDPRQHATLAQLEALFAAAYPINQQRGATRGVAMGRYAGDVYYSGGAYYFSSLGAAEFCYQAAVAMRADARPMAAAFIARGDGFLETVRAFTPPSGALSEQFDQRTGVQSSAKELAWSYAAFISCANARRSALAIM
jgi:glucoamylase